MVSCLPKQSQGNTHEQTRRADRVPVYLGANIIACSEGSIDITWIDADVTNLAGAPPAAGKPFGYVTSSEVIARVVYRGRDAHIHEMWLRRGSSWKHADLTSLTDAPPAASDPAAYSTNFDETARVIYRGSDGHIHELWLPEGGVWAHADLTQIAAAPPAGGVPQGFYDTTVSSMARVVYRGNDNHIHELHFGQGPNLES